MPTMMPLTADIGTPTLIMVASMVVVVGTPTLVIVMVPMMMTMMAMVTVMPMMVPMVVAMRTVVVGSVAVGAGRDGVAVDGPV